MVKKVPFIGFRGVIDPITLLDLPQYHIVALNNMSFNVRPCLR